MKIMVGPNGLEPSTSSVSRFVRTILPMTSILLLDLLNTRKHVLDVAIAGWNHGLGIACRTTSLVAISLPSGQRFYFFGTSTFRQMTTSVARRSSPRGLRGDHTALPLRCRERHESGVGGSVTSAMAGDRLSKNCGLAGGHVTLSGTVQPKVSSHLSVFALLSPRREFIVRPVSAKLWPLRSP